MIIEEPDYSLFRVVVFKKDASDFTNAARAKRFTVRKHDPEAALSEEEIKQLNSRLAKLKKQLLRYASTPRGSPG